MPMQGAPGKKISARLPDPSRDARRRGRWYFCGCGMRRLVCLAELLLFRTDHAGAASSRFSIRRHHDRREAILLENCRRFARRVPLLNVVDKAELVLRFAATAMEKSPRPEHGEGC